MLEELQWLSASKVGFKILVYIVCFPILINLGEIIMDFINRIA